MDGSAVIKKGLLRKIEGQTTTTMTTTQFSMLGDTDDTLCHCVCCFRCWHLRRLRLSLYPDFILRLILRDPTLINLNNNKKTIVNLQSKCPQNPQSSIFTENRSVRPSIYSLSHFIFYSARQKPLYSGRLDEELRSYRGHFRQNHRRLARACRDFPWYDPLVY